MMDLAYYFKQWRLKHANVVVRFFKDKKTNVQREAQLQQLDSIRHVSSDAVKLGALIQISNDIGKEHNLFSSEMKKQVDRMIRAHLSKAECGAAQGDAQAGVPKKPAPLSKQKTQLLKQHCLDAFQAHQQRYTACVIPFQC